MDTQCDTTYVLRPKENLSIVPGRSCSARSKKTQWNNDNPGSRSGRTLGATLWSKEPHWHCSTVGSLVSSIYATAQELNERFSIDRCLLCSSEAGESVGTDPCTEDIAYCSCHDQPPVKLNWVTWSMFPSIVFSRCVYILWDNNIPH